MNSIQLPRLRTLVLAQACALFAVSFASAQQTAKPSPTQSAQDAQALAKYDKNKNGRLDADERATMAADEASATPQGDVLQMTPFQVDTSRDRGYAAENTLAGSRLNSKLEDLAAAITVVTKQQLEDTASLDINDVFKYEVSTEGSTSYTPSVVDRGTFKDTVAGYTFGNDGATTTNAQSNRLRGLSSPDAAMNYYPTNSRIPFDSYNTQSVEISRGPNSLLFGLGSPSGIVNQSSAQAALNRNTNSVSLRTDQVGSFRSSLQINRSIIKDKLAIYGALLYNDQQFERKPSFELTRRQFGAITYHPFKKTYIRAFAENFDNRANRPNFTTPRDMVTPWIQAGRPSYDPVTRTVTIKDATVGGMVGGTSGVVRPAGTVLGPIVFDTRSPGFGASGTTLTGTALITNTTSPWYIPFGLTFNTSGSPLERFDNGNRIDYFGRAPGFYAPAQTNPATTVPTPTSLGWVNGDPRFAILDRQWTAPTAGLNPTTVINGTTYTYSTYNALGVNNKSIYDYSKYNLNQVNFSRTRAANYNIEIEHAITDKLFFSAGWFRQDIDSAENNILAQLQGQTLQVDTNVNLINGQPNPYYGLPLVELGVGSGVDTFYHPETDDNYRVMLSYDLDFSKNKGWTKWFGRHKLLGLWSEQDAFQQVERWRSSYTTGADPSSQLRFGFNPNSAPGATLWGRNTNIHKYYYLANPGDAQGVVSQSTGYYGNPGADSPYLATVNAWDYQTNTFSNAQVGEQTVFADAGSFSSYREVQSVNLAAQSFLWNDRIVLTMGQRHDIYRARRTSIGPLVAYTGGPQVQGSLGNDQLFLNGTNGLENHDAIMNRWNGWDKLSGYTRTLGGAFRPFKDLGFTRRLGGEGSLASEFVQGLSFYYNKSSNFNPPPAAQTDYFKRPLAKPTGKGKDKGIGFSLFNNKLVARVNWFELENKDERSNLATTLLTRSIYADTTLGIPWASTVQRIRNGIAGGRTLAQIVSATNWNTNAVNDVSDSVSQQKIYDLMQLPLNYYAGITVAGTQQSVAKGTELQLTYNPASNWTIKLTGSKSESIYSKVAPQYDEWIAERMPKWLNIAANDIPDFTDGAGREYSLHQFWTAYGYTGVALKENPNTNTSTVGYFNTNVASEVANSKQLEGAVAPNQRVYHASLLTNYSFRQGKLKGFSIGGSERWESRAAVGFYGKVSHPLTAPTVIDAQDVTRPVYLDNGNYYTDLWISYSRKIWGDRIDMKIQLNCNDVTEGGGLQPVAVNWDGKPWAYRIVDPRQFILTTTFGF